MPVRSLSFGPIPLRLLMLQPFTLQLLLTMTVGSVAAEEPKLPRVLILGDPVYGELSRAVGDKLKGKAEVVYARWQSGEIANSSTVLDHLDRLLGQLDKQGQLLPEEQRPRWDLIHFNLGLGDLVYRAPGLRSFRVMSIHAGGVRTTSAEAYRSNLDELVQRLQATGSKLVWASTTPIRHSRANIFEVGSEVEYNRIAEAVMVAHQVPINDLHAYAKSRMQMDKPVGHADPFYFDRAPIHEPVADAIASHLARPPVAQAAP